MALQFSTPITTSQGFTVDAAYIRVTSVDLANGSQIKALTEYFISKEAFESGAQPFMTTSFSEDATFTTVFAYDRNRDGSDSLMFAHTNLVSEFAKVGITATIVGLQ